MTELDPYAELGVPKTASTEEIRRARRRLAKRLHPDRKGGDPARMARVNQAVTILEDPQRRAYYDGTGNTAPPKTDEQKARDMVLNGFRQGIQAAMESALPINIPRTVVTGLKKQLAEIKAKLPEGEDLLAALESFRGELQTDDPFDMWIGVVESGVDNLREQLEQAREQMKLIPLAIDIAERYRSGVIECQPGSARYWEESNKGPRKVRYRRKR